MGKLTKLNKDLFNLNNIKEVIKKSVQVVGLTSALFMGGMGLTGCQQDIPYEPEEPTIEQPVEKPTEKPEEKDHCGICTGIQDETHEHDYCDTCDDIQTDPNHTCPVVEEPTPSQPLTPLEPAKCADEDCLKKGQSMEGHTHDYCNEQECAHIDVTDKNHVHDYCNIGDCANITVTDKNHQHDYCGDKTCLNKDKTSPDHQHDYCNEGDCKDINVTDKDHQHDYCGDGTCLNKDKTSPDHTHDYCGDETCLNNKENPNHEHDYCKGCEGNQTDPKHTCPPKPTLSAEVKSIGNGTYSIANFMVSSKDDLDEKISENLECAEKYIKGFADCFKDTANNQNLQNLVNVLETESTYSTNNTTGFDPIINKLNNACAPIFEEIIENIDTPLDRYSFICYYNALSNEAYKHGSGDYFNGNQTQEDTYNDKKEQIQRDFADNYAFEGLPTPFNIIEDIENNNCDKITKEMKTLLTNSNVANDMGISEFVLDNIIDFSANITSFDAMHDYSASKKLSTHASCVTSGNTLENVMLEKTVELDNAGMAMLNNKNNIQDRELC